MGDETSTSPGYNIRHADVAACEVAMALKAQNIVTGTKMALLNKMVNNSNFG